MSQRESSPFNQLFHDSNKEEGSHKMDIMWCPDIAHIHIRIIFKLFQVTYKWLSRTLSVHVNQAKQ